MAFEIITDRTRARRICPDCGVEPIGRPRAKRCIECTDKAIDAAAHAGSMRTREAKRAPAAPRDIAQSIARAIERDRELDRLHELRIGRTK